MTQLARQDKTYDVTTNSFPKSEVCPILGSRFQGFSLRLSCLALLPLRGATDHNDIVLPRGSLQWGAWLILFEAPRVGSFICCNLLWRGHWHTTSLWSVRSFSARISLHILYSVRQFSIKSYLSVHRWLIRQFFMCFEVVLHLPCIGFLLKESSWLCLWGGPLMLIFAM